MKESIKYQRRADTATLIGLCSISACVPLMVAALYFAFVQEASPALSFAVASVFSAMLSLRMFQKADHLKDKSELLKMYERYGVRLK